ncbi:MAG: DUF2149 domain-containing protein [Clostridiales Family XIII bacterium]|jgi:hypothetical protein|nr:DUF2149 domain-containing protein [Clostridiales Family XIII bacterium]
MLGTGLRSGRRYFDQEDANPMEGAINIVDAMLVFACGLMLSLVIYWNVDLNSQDLVPMSQGRDVTEVEGMQEDLQKSVSGEGLYERLGTVYVDPATGKMYMVTGDVPAGVSGTAVQEGSNTVGEGAAGDAEATAGSGAAGEGSAGGEGTE